MQILWIWLIFLEVAYLVHLLAWIESGIGSFSALRLIDRMLPHDQEYRNHLFLFFVRDEKVFLDSLRNSSEIF